MGQEASNSSCVKRCSWQVKYSSCSKSASVGIKLKPKSSDMFINGTLYSRFGTLSQQTLSPRSLLPFKRLARKPKSHKLEVTQNMQASTVKRLADCGGSANQPDKSGISRDVEGAALTCLMKSATGTDHSVPFCGSKSKTHMRYAALRTNLLRSCCVSAVRAFGKASVLLRTSWVQKATFGQL